MTAEHSTSLQRKENKQKENKGLRDNKRVGTMQERQARRATPPGDSTLRKLQQLNTCPAHGVCKPRPRCPEPHPALNTPHQNQTRSRAPAQTPSNSSRCLLEGQIQDQQATPHPCHSRPHPTPTTLLSPNSGQHVTSTLAGFPVDLLR